MKNSLLLILLSIIIPLNSGCDSSALDSYSSYKYDLNLYFLNKQGEDRVVGIPTENAKPQETVKIAREAYTWRLISGDGGENKLFTSPLTLHKQDGFQALHIPISTTSSQQYRPTVVEYTLVCPHIFGDEQEHTLISYWERQGSYNNQCLYITLDDKRFESTQSKGNWCYEAVVVLD